MKNYFEPSFGTVGLWYDSMATTTFLAGEWRVTNNRIRERRYELGMTLAEMARCCGVPISTLSDIERGAEPLVTTGQRIARALGVSVDDLWSI